MVVIFILAVLAIMFEIVWYLEKKNNMHTLIETTPVPYEHIFVTLALHKEGHR